MHKDKSFWLGHVEALLKQGCSTGSYARAHDLREGTLYYWRRKVESNTVVAPKKPAHFVALQVTPEVLSMQRSGCRLHLGRDTVLEMDSLPSVEWLAQLSQQIRRVN